MSEVPVNIKELEWKIYQTIVGRRRLAYADNPLHDGK